MTSNWVHQNIIHKQANHNNNNNRKRLLSGSNRETVFIALQEEVVFPSPVEHTKIGVECEQERLTGSIEMVTTLDLTWRQCSEHLKAKNSDRLVWFYSQVCL